MPEKRREFDGDFRAPAVRVVKESPGKVILQIARDLGINEAPWATGPPGTLMPTRRGRRAR